MIFENQGRQGPRGTRMPSGDKLSFIYQYIRTFSDSLICEDLIEVHVLTVE